MMWAMFVASITLQTSIGIDLFNSLNQSLLIMFNFRYAILIDSKLVGSTLKAHEHEIHMQSLQLLPKPTIAQIA